jgi:SPP1 family predicted phage head-tail adaptor
MRAGRLRRRIEIQALISAQDGYGEPLESWATTATVWGELTPSMRATREAFAGVSQQRAARLTMEARVRFMDGLSPSTTRLRSSGRVYEVEAVMDPDGRQRELLLFCYMLE